MQIGAKRQIQKGEVKRPARNERRGLMLLVIVKTYPVPSGHLRGAQKGWRSGVGGLSVTQPEVEGGGGPEKGAFLLRGICGIHSFVRTKGGCARVGR